MPLLTFIAGNWQKALPALAVIGAIAWVVLFRGNPASERAMFAALLVIYMLHQIEEHLWPGGFRQYTNAHVFKSGDDNWPVDVGGVALVNIGYVWLPLAAAALFPGALRCLGLAWIGLTLINAITHVVTSIRFRGYNPPGHLDRAAAAVHAVGAGAGGRGRRALGHGDRPHRARRRAAAHSPRGAVRHAISETARKGSVANVGCAKARNAPCARVTREVAANSWRCASLCAPYKRRV